MSIRLCFLVVILWGATTSVSHACSCASGSSYWPQGDLPANGRIVVTWAGLHPVFGSARSDHFTPEHWRFSKERNEHLALLADDRSELVEVEVVRVHDLGKARQAYLRPKSILTVGKRYALAYKGEPITRTWLVREPHLGAPAWKASASASHVVAMAETSCETQVLHVSADVGNDAVVGTKEQLMLVEQVTSRDLSTGLALVDEGRFRLGGQCGFHRSLFYEQGGAIRLTPIGFNGERGSTVRIEVPKPDPKTMKREVIRINISELDTMP